MEVCEKLSHISESLKVLQDGCAGRVTHVENYTCTLNFANLNFMVRPQLRKPQKIFDHENFSAYSILSFNL